MLETVILVNFEEERERGIFGRESEENFQDSQYSVL